MAAKTDAAKPDTNDTKPESVGGKGSKARYKYCIVPGCKSTTVKTPQKLFFSIPTGELRESWCEVMGRRPPACKPLSPLCNRFCCEDHFDLEKDMDNYIKWKLMGREGTSKLILKKGVFPHKFDCQRAKPEATKTQQVEKKYRKECIQDILEEARKKNMGGTLDQRFIEVKKHHVNILKQTKKIKVKQNRKVRKLPTEDDILEQRKKIGKISHTTQTFKERQEQDIDSYTFQIKIEAEDMCQSNDGDSILEKWLLQGIHPAGEDNSHLLGVDVKVEELDEEFEPELVEIKQENLTDDKADVKTEIIPVLMENTAPFINVTKNLIEATSDDNKCVDFEPLVKEYTQGMIEETSNSLSTKTNKFVMTENIRDKEVFERVIIGKKIQEVVEDDTKNTL